MAQSETVERILDAAEQLFAEKGFAETSLRLITSKAGVNLAAVNYHFGSKKALIQAVFSRFLGPFCNEELSLSLDSLSHHRFLRLSLDLYTARSWDGNHPDFGPDLVTIRVAGGPTLLHTSFAYGPQRQSFPDSYPYGDHKADTGSTSTRTLGYTFREAPADAVYRLRFVVPHRASAVTFQFSAGGLSTAPTDEFWGLDNVAVEALGAARELRPADAERLWADLEGGDPGRINPAIAEWVLAGEARIAFLRNKLAATRDARRRAKRAAGR